MKLKNRILGILISTVILSAIALTGIFENTIRSVAIFMVLIIGLFTIIPYLLEKLGNKQKG
ncbi:MAG: hypothetical protein A2049_01855 [Elusimicrobia bacterium GWA2_62_23]|nr:MAG: hypothetical protein A2049_01855 [Elusimicrobia bacterium GWA2_62_23]HBB66622.1 hypothetical protein [Elusimicrobiota bacterium]